MSSRSEIFGGKTLTTAQVSVTSTATQIAAPLAGRLRLTLKNTGTVTVFIGATSGVLATTGHALLANETLTLLTESAIYGIVVTTTCVVTYASEAL